MNKPKSLMPIIVMQFIPLVIVPPDILLSVSGAIFVALIIALFVGLGIALTKRKAWARTLSIFLHGFNIIVRIMMVFPNARLEDGAWDLTFILASLISIAISFWFLQRLDKPDFVALVTS